MTKWQSFAALNFSFILIVNIPGNTLNNDLVTCILEAVKMYVLK